MGGATLYIEARGRLPLEGVEIANVFIEESDRNEQREESQPRESSNLGEPSDMQVTGQLGTVREDVCSRVRSREIFPGQGTDSSQRPRRSYAKGWTFCRGYHGHSPCQPDVAMTGELTLMGKVLKVGGIQEKVIASRRENVKTVLMPRRSSSRVDPSNPMLWIPTVPYASAGHTNLAGCAPVLTGSRSFQRAEGQTYRGAVTLSVIAGVGVARRSHRRSAEAFGNAELLQLEMQSDEPEALSELLEGLGAHSTAVRGLGASDGILRETAMDQTPLWKTAIVTGMFSANVDVEKIVSAVQSCFDLTTPPAWTVTRVQDIDWVEHVQRSWQPMKLGKGFQVLLPWHEGPEGGATSNGRRVLRLEGGAAFGLGDHPTTQGAVEFLEKVLVAGTNANVLDYGTGSGILAICAAELGASTVVGVDVDEGSVESAKRSSTSSLGVKKSVVFRCSPEDFAAAEEFASGLVKQFGPFTVVVANILRRPLVGLAPALACSCDAGARLALTGLRRDLKDGEAVREAFSPAFHNFVDIDLPGGWLLVEAERAEKGICKFTIHRYP
eukprot:symbB.v1.2.027451.t2/scaffold2817.1/size69569/6